MSKFKSMGNLNTLRQKTVVYNNMIFKVLPPLLREYKEFEQAIETPSEEYISQAEIELDKTKKSLQDNYDALVKLAGDSPSEDQTNYINKLKGIIDENSSEDRVKLMAKGVMRVEFLFNCIVKDESEPPITYDEILAEFDQKTIGELVEVIEKAIT